MTTMIRVVKVGGSLFSFAGMPEIMYRWLNAQPAGTTLFIGGGGDLVQPLRGAQERFRLDQEASHWLAVRAMTVTSRLLAKLLDVELVEQFETVEQLVRLNRQAACVLDVEQFLRQREPEMPGARLPLDWSCTSDAIAARVAEVLSANELVLVKSVTYPAGLSLTAAAAQDLVDGHFPKAITDLRRIRWVNLRSSNLEEAEILP